MAIKHLDHDLILEAQRGSRSHLEQLLVKAQPDIRRYAMKHCMIGDVDDAVQEVLLSMARYMESLRVAAALSSWLFTSTRRECRRLGRVALRYDPLDEARVDEWLGSASSPELLFEIVSAIDSLPDDLKQVLLFKDYEQLSNKEIAERLGVTVAAVKSRLHRARISVRAILLGLDSDADNTPA
ncbi:RNA polymerase sigma factor [Thalassolituus sp.]|uniref:RNA polymerase sigma factor n=1 Tax=Thalassolituus sp. TaxID=2030822 RepID=UPI0035171307